MATRQWHVVCTEAQSEYLAAAALEHNGLELFFPCVKTARPRVGHTTTPLFPGYIFLRFDPEEGWPPIHQIPYILGWLRFQGDVPAVPDEVIAQLVQQVEAINFGGGLWTRFRPGEKVRVVGSVMEGVAEILEEAKSPQARVRVLLDFMDRLVPAEIAWQNLQPIGDELEGAAQRRLGDRRTRGRGRWIRGFGHRSEEFGI